MPSQRTLAGGIVRECAEKYNDAAKLFNLKLSKELDSLGHNSPNSKIVYIDAYTPLLDIILNYQKYGNDIWSQSTIEKVTMQPLYYTFVNEVFIFLLNFRVQSCG